MIPSSSSKKRKRILLNDTHFFIEEEEEDLTDPEPLDELLEPLNPPIEIKPLPSGLKYVFLNNDHKFPVIISNKLPDEETYKLITVLEKHHIAFGYSLQDLKRISPVFFALIAYQPIQK